MHSIYLPCIPFLSWVTGHSVVSENFGALTDQMICWIVGMEQFLFKPHNKVETRAQNAT